MILNEAKQNNEFIVRFDLLRIVNKSDKMFAPHIIIPYEVYGELVENRPEIIISLWGGSSFKWEILYKNVSKVLDTFEFDTEGNTAHSIPKDYFIESAIGTCWNFTGNSDKIVRDFLEKQISKVWHECDVKFKGSLTSKEVSKLASKIAEYFRMK